MKKLILGIASLAIVFASCSDDDDSTTPNVDNKVIAAVISGGPYNFTVCDGTDDKAADVAITDAGSGSLSTFLVTDDQGVILGMPGTLEAVQTGPNFDGAGAGVCYIWHLNYEEGIEGLAMSENANDLTGDFALSNKLTVNRTSVLNAGVISGGTDNVYTFVVGDGEPDLAADLAIDGSAAVGTGRTWVITKGDGEILGLPATLADAQENNFDEAPAGTCLIWYMRYEGTLEDIGAVVGANATTDLKDCYALSNEVTVERIANAEAPVIAGGPFTFTAGDGNVDNVSGISVTDEGVGESSTWVITDFDGNILGLPPTLADVEANNFDGAGVGVCLIWYLRFTGDLENATPMVNNASEIEGNFALSNSIQVNREAAVIQ